MSKTSRVVFHGLIEEKESFKKRMFALGVPPEMVEIILSKAPVILKSGMSAEEARRYAHAVQEAGGKVTIQEYEGFEESRQESLPVSIPTFGDFTMCPECGLKQPRGETCERCGYAFIKKEPVEDVPGH